MIVKLCQVILNLECILQTTPTIDIGHDIMIPKYDIVNIDIDIMNYLRYTMIY